jgi:hypothetical protein
MKRISTELQEIRKEIGKKPIEILEKRLFLCGKMIAILQQIKGKKLELKRKKDKIVNEKIKAALLHSRRTDCNWKEQ